MIKLFIDTSVILTASKSKSGASSYICMLCRKRKVQGYISRYVIYEAKTKSTYLLTSQEKQRLNFLLLQCSLIIITEPSDADIQTSIQIIEKKDAPIIAAAKSVSVDYLLTLNTKDFMQTKVKEWIKPTQIITPKAFLKKEKIA